MAFGDADLLLEALVLAFQKDGAFAIDDSEAQSAACVFLLDPNKVGDSDFEVSDDIGSDVQLGAIGGSDRVRFFAFQKHELLGFLAGFLGDLLASVVKEFVESNLSIVIEIGFSLQSL